MLYLKLCAVLVEEFSGWYEDNWFELNLDKEGINCTVEQMKEVAEGHLTTEALMWNQNKNERTISGMTSDDFKKRFDDELLKVGFDPLEGRYPIGYQEAPLAYDAVWAVALGIWCLQTLNVLHLFGHSSF